MLAYKKESINLLYDKRSYLEVYLLLKISQLIEYYFLVFAYEHKSAVWFVMDYLLKKAINIH